MTFRVLANPRPQETASRQSALLQDTHEPWDTHRLLPGYKYTPLVEAPVIADELGAAAVFVKDESCRLGLPSFKMLGASWATLRTVAQAWAPDVQPPYRIEELRKAVAGQRAGLVAATDGNHGRGVARMAALLGLHCTILVPNGTAEARITAIADEGAEVTVVDGDYDAAVAQSATAAATNTLVISDTSWDGYETTPRAVIQGYSTLFHEIDEQLAERRAAPFTVLALQAGVGAFAAAGLHHLQTAGGAAGRVTGKVTGKVTTVIVEPSTANCLMESARVGAITPVPGPHRSTMAGLNCGSPSKLAWPVVSRADVFMAIDDEWTYAAMRLLADVGVVAGESGAAALGGLLAAASTPESRSLVGLDERASVLVVNTEGATDPSNYRQVVGVRAPGGDA